jgi:hypothetical protein
MQPQQQQQVIEQRRRREEAEKREKEELIRQQQELIEEQNRQIEELKRLQSHQQQQHQLHVIGEEEEYAGDQMVKSTEVQLDDIMNDLTQIICAADDSALPDTILNDLRNMELRSAVVQPLPPPQQRQVQTQPVVPTTTAPRVRPMSAYHAAASVVAPLPRQGVQPVYRSPVQSNGVGMAHTGTRAACCCRGCHALSLSVLRFSIGSDRLLPALC